MAQIKDETEYLFNNIINKRWNKANNQSEISTQIGFEEEAKLGSKTAKAGTIGKVNIQSQRNIMKVDKGPMLVSRFNPDKDIRRNHVEKKTPETDWHQKMGEQQDKGVSF